MFMFSDQVCYRQSKAYRCEYYDNRHLLISATRNGKSSQMRMQVLVPGDQKNGRTRQTAADRSKSPEKKPRMAGPDFTGAGERARTVDLYLGKVPLYQLSYTRGRAQIVAGRPGLSRTKAVRRPDRRSFRYYWPLCIAGHAARR